MIDALLGAVLGYALGSIPFGLLLAKAGGYGDIRRIGSGNIGATNVLRTGNKGLAAATLILDGGKGAAATLLAAALWGGPPGENWAAVLAAGGAMLGHAFPVWLGFKGGKGVATAIGVLLALAWPVGLFAMLTWLATALTFRISSLSALTALALAALFAWGWAGPGIGAVAVLIAVLVFIRHHENIGRLLRGVEPRIGGGARRA